MANGYLAPAAGLATGIARGYELAMQLRARREAAEAAAKDQQLKRALQFGPILKKTYANQMEAGNKDAAAATQKAIDTNFVAPILELYPNLNAETVNGVYEVMAGNPTGRNQIFNMMERGELTATNFWEVTDGLPAPVRMQALDQLGKTTDQQIAVNQELRDQTEFSERYWTKETLETIRLNGFNPATNNPEELARIKNTLGKQAFWDGLGAQVKNILVAERKLNVDTYLPQDVSSAMMQAEGNRIREAGSTRYATETAGYDAAEDRTLSSKDQNILRGWVDAFKAQHQRLPTYRDATNASVSVPDPQTSREFLTRRIGTEEVVNLINRLVPLLTATGEGVRGAPQFMSKVISQLTSTTRGFINIFDTALDQHRDLSFVQFVSESANDPTVLSTFDEYTVKGEQSRLLTLQLAFSLAAAAGLSGRAVTSTILKERFLPQAASSINNPRIAREILTALADVTVSQFNIYQRATLGTAVPDTRFAIVNGATGYRWDGTDLPAPGDMGTELSTLRKQSEEELRALLLSEGIIAEPQ